MTPLPEPLRRSAAHVLVDDLDDPQLSERSAHHLLRVRRLRADEVVTLTDGRGRWRTAHVTDSGFAELGHPHDDVADLAGELFVAIPKQDRPEWIVQKATELGVGRIVFLHADRSVVRWEGGRAAKHLERLRSTAAEALMQSRRTRLPTIEGPLASRDVLEGTGAVLLADPDGRPLATGDRRIAIGPEGGWSPAERELAADMVSLGRHVLRVETAALTACALMAHNGVAPGS